MKTTIAIIALVILVVGVYAVFRKSDNVLAPTAPISQNDNTIAYTNNAGGFSFSYPKEYQVVEGDSLPTQSWQLNTSVEGRLYATLSIPRESQPGTNFSEARMTVGSTDDTSTVATCRTPANGEELAGTKTINGTDYTILRLSDAAAGNLYTVTSYRTVRNATCYAIDFMVHSTNIANYPEEFHIAPYDTAKIDAVFNPIMSSFTFNK